MWICHRRMSSWLKSSSFFAHTGISLVVLFVIVSASLTHIYFRSASIRCSCSSSAFLEICLGEEATPFPSPPHPHFVPEILFLEGHPSLKASKRYLILRNRFQNRVLNCGGKEAGERKKEAINLTSKKRWRAMQSLNWGLPSITFNSAGLRQLNRVGLWAIFARKIFAGWFFIIKHKMLSFFLCYFFFLKDRLARSVFFFFFAIIGKFKSHI